MSNMELNRMKFNFDIISLPNMILYLAQKSHFDKIKFVEVQK